MNKDDNNFENENVHFIYSKIAKHFDTTRVIIWSKVQDSRFETVVKGTELTTLKDFLVYLNKKKDHYQAIVDNGEDPNGLDLEDLADIEASAP